MTEVTAREVGETRWSFDAVAESAGDARQALREHAVSHGAAAEIQDAIALCVTEAVTNAVVHAYRDRPPARAGAGRSPATRRRDLRPRTRPRIRTYPRVDSPGLGLGMPLMASLAQRFEIRTASGGG